MDGDDGRAASPPEQRAHDGLPPGSQPQCAVPADTPAARRGPGFDSPLETKLHPPAARAEWVQREDLLDRLAGLSARLLLVDAPAGFGKTTLVAQWCWHAAESRPFAWVSVDAADNDPGRLWWHVICALRQACPQLGMENLTAAIRTPAPDFAGTLLPLLINELAAMAEPVVIVLDDYHVIEDRDCHDQVAFLLLHLPEAVQLTLITRVDPPLPLARLRAAGDMAEIGVRELRFSATQAAALVADVAGLELSEADLDSLTEQTEGWPAGIYLAALSLRTHASPSDFIRQFTGESRFVGDFLAEEVLRGQPAEVRQFLARTSILSRLQASLVDSVLESANAAEVMSLLERENLFVVPLDDSRQWFRYHHLFAQVLRGELDRTEPEIIHALHERASAWHARSGSADEAVHHAYAAGDPAAVIDIISTNWFAYIGAGQVATVRGWLSLLGDGIVSVHPHAVHCAAWTAALSGDRESLRRWLPLLEGSPHEGRLPDGVSSMQASAALLRGTFGFDGIGPMRDAAAQAARLEADPASPWYAMARAAYATALYWCDDFVAAAEQAQSALSSPSSVGLIRMLALATLALLEVDQGQLAEAEQLARSAREIVAGEGLGAAPQAALAYAAAGAVHARQGQLADARREFERALRIRRRHYGISPWATMEIMLRLAPVLLDAGDRPAAVALLAEARELLMSAPDGADAQLERVARLERRLAGPPRAILAAPLTDRELAVLRLLRGSLSLREIGLELYLSQNTIKTHTKAIYRKLGVTSRGEAIAKSRDIDIL
ncbi:MAG TPA: LuxR C-terminal-related transcriptional regulator [Streptosporangiaceae bacterium]